MKEAGWSRWLKPNQSACALAFNRRQHKLPEFGFPGLKDGDGWCLCASWYAKAVEADKACPIYLKRTHQNTLKYLPIETLKKFAIDLS